MLGPLGQFVTREGTTRDGTSAAGMAAALNSHSAQFGAWRLARPNNRDAYLSHVAVDTYQYHQPVIVGVDTQWL
ncbi:MAG: hypothetical protein ACR2KL_03005, partial [Nocardioidaceae bacterium]